MGALERPNFKISQFRLPCYIPSMIMKRRFSILCASLLLSLTGWAVDTLVLEAKEGPGKGKRVVLISGDEEYRSEEALPMLGKILSQHHGFHCTVVFALDEAGKYIDSNNQQGLRGLAALDGADLMAHIGRSANMAEFANVENSHPVPYRINWRCLRHGHGFPR